MRMIALHDFFRDDDPTRFYIAAEQIIAVKTIAWNKSTDDWLVQVIFRPSKIENAVLQNVGIPALSSAEAASIAAAIAELVNQSEVRANAALGDQP